jgi:hypothetical protein
MLILVIVCLSSYYRFVLLPHYELMPPRASITYVQTILSDVARGSPQLVRPLVSQVCHRFGPDLFLCGYKSIIACTFQLLICHILVGQHSAPYNITDRITVI